MTKEIIIDGVNVAECKDYCTLLKDGCAFGGTKKCSEIHNCYFKQLQHLKQENEELKAKIDSCNDEFGCKQMAEYKQALEVIRKYCEEQNLKADYTACEILTIIDEVSDEQF